MARICCGCAAQYRERRDVLLAALQRHFGAPDVSGADGGLHVFWQLPPGVPDAATLETLARRARIGLYPIGAGGGFEARPSALGRRGLVLGYAALSPRQIEQGIARLSDIIDDTLDSRHEFLDALMVDSPAPGRPGPQAAARHPGTFRSRPYAVPHRLGQSRGRPTPSRTVRSCPSSRDFIAIRSRD